MSAADLTEDECRALAAVTPHRRLHRCPTPGAAYRIQFADRTTALGQMTFSEAVVGALIEKGLMRALQVAAAHAGHPAQPFTVALSPDGEREHHRLAQRKGRP